MPPLPSTTPCATAYCEIDFPLPQGEGRLRAVFAAPEAVLVAHTRDEVPALLARVEALALEGCWAVGGVAYEAAAAFDAALTTRERAADLPYAMFAVYRQPAALARPRGDYLIGAWRDATEQATFDATVAAIRRGITDGDYYQINYTTRLAASVQGDSLAFYDGLRASQPDAYCAYLDFGRWRICSVSPEMFFHWGTNDDGGGRMLSSRPMKGTAARDADAERDREAALRLRQSPKECAENLMIVDLIRNDLSRVARLGTVAVPELFAVEAWPTLWQMTSTVACRTRANVTLSGVFGALFPCGSVTGAPKAAAMQAIAAIEATPRGFYCGAVGVVMPGGEALFNVAIRTAVINAAAGVVECGIGSGITLDSVAADEYAEWQTKQLFLKRACPDYELLETLRLHRGRLWLRCGHLARLQASAAALGFHCDLERINTALAAAASAHPAGDWRVRLRLAADGAIGIDVLPLDSAPALPTIALAAESVASANPWLRHKTTRRELYEALAARQAGVFDTLLYNERNELTEFTRGNLILDLDGCLVTPAASCGLLPGVYRQALLAHHRVHEAILTVEDLRRARRTWFVNSLRGAFAVQPT